MRTDSEFWIASQTKAMTAAAVMMLVDEGRIGLEDPVQKHLPEFNDLRVAAESDKDHVLLKRPSRAITIRMLLSHTSGRPFRSRLEEATLDGVPLRDAVRSYAMTPLIPEPGTKHQYSNAGINTAARVLEVVSGMAHEDFMQQRLFDPLGMDDTTFWPSERQAKRLARSYKPNAAKDDLVKFQIPQLVYPPSSRAGHGGAHATDMTVDWQHGGIITIWMVQHAGFPLDGGKAKETFRKAAMEQFAPAPPPAK